jgi:hypothetical protein
MARVMPSQVVQMIDGLFPHAAKGGRGGFMAGHGPHLFALVRLLQGVPDELITADAAGYLDLVLAVSTIEDTLEHWRLRGNVGEMPHVKGEDVASVIRRVLVKCPDEFPAPAATELLFIADTALRENIRRDVGAVQRALSNAEWKAATVLAGATIEALLHWRLQEPLPGPAAITATVTALVKNGTIKKQPNTNLDRWELHHFIAVADELRLLSPDTCNAARLAQNFRNLIHPGRSARLGQACNRGTALSAAGALEHVIVDLT